eukprot:949023-Amphidinium_carterae.1
MQTGYPPRIPGRHLSGTPGSFEFAAIRIRPPTADRSGSNSPVWGGFRGRGLHNSTMTYLLACTSELAAAVEPAVASLLVAAAAADEPA